MATEQSLWFRIGYALERARHPTPSRGKRLARLSERASAEKARRRGRPEPDTPSTEDLVSTGLVLSAVKLLDTWRPRRRTGLIGLARAAAAGAASALLLDLVRPLLTGRPTTPALDGDTGERLLAGAGEGLLYGAVVEPRLPGPTLLKGALFASAEYASDPAGGLTQLVGAHAPLRRLPLVGRLLHEMDVHDRSYIEHLTFGIALALLYGSSRSNNGMLVEEEDA